MDSLSHDLDGTGYASRMTEIDSKRLDELSFIDTLYGDPVRPETVKAGRNLTIGSLLLLAVSKFGAQLQSTSLFPVTFQNPDVLPTVLAIVVALLLLNFLGRVVMDVGLLVEGDQRIAKYIWDAKVAAAVGAASDVDDDISRQHDDEGSPDPDPWWDEVGKVREAAQMAEEKIEAKLGRRSAFRLVRYLRGLAEVNYPHHARASGANCVPAPMAVARPPAVAAP